MLEFLQQQTGLKLVTKTKQVNQKVKDAQDEETMLTAARQKTILKKQTAVFPVASSGGLFGSQTFGSSGFGATSPLFAPPV